LAERRTSAIFWGGGDFVSVQLIGTGSSGGPIIFPSPFSAAGNVVAGTKVMKQCRPSTIHGKFSAAQETSPIFPFDLLYLPYHTAAEDAPMALPEINRKNWREILRDARVPSACS